MFFFLVPYFQYTFGTEIKLYLCNPVALLFLLLYLYIFASFNLVWLILTISHFLYFMTFLTVSQYCSQNFHNLIYQSKLFRCEVPCFGIYYCFSWYIVLLFQLQKTVLIGRITFRYATFFGRRQYSTVLYLSCLPLGTSWLRRKNCTREKLYLSILLVSVCKIPVFFDLSISFRPKRDVPNGRSNLTKSQFSVIIYLVLILLY